jgi:tRNA pseudouridine38-40 synthase
MTFSYDGSKYLGYQKQRKGSTVQEELESALTKINSEKKVSVSASGRTDAGVHAINQAAHFDLNGEHDENKILVSLNSLLPDDIYVKKVERVSNDFHARFDAKAKEYIYKINMGEYNPIEKDYIHQYNKRLNVPEIERALKYLEGTHDFKSFTKNDEEQEDYTRTIIQTNLIRDMRELNKITISILGTGFMRYMVRNIVGVLIEVGEGKRKSEDIFHILAAKDRRVAGKTAPPNGLYLKDVLY